MDISVLSSKLPIIVMEELPSVIDKFEITNELRLAHFLAQCAEESENFTAVRENLNYSSNALMSVFKKYFPDIPTALAYQRNPQKIANKVYANRMGNGDEASGDGWNFRGRGYIQDTGKDNYKAFSDFIGEDCVASPDLIATKYPLASAAFFFEKNGLWTICDKGATPDVVTLLTRHVNGGTNGLPQRLADFLMYNNLLT